ALAHISTLPLHAALPISTENPSFELIAPLLSRARVLVFKSLDAAAIEKLLARAEEIEGKKLPLDDEARASLIRMADGDGRASLRSEEHTSELQSLTTLLC